jgi:hypothetical protein
MTLHCAELTAALFRGRSLLRKRHIIRNSIQPLVQRIDSKIWQQGMYPGRVGLVERPFMAQTPLSSTTLTRQQMAQICTFVFDRAALGKSEAFGGAARRLNLRHKPGPTPPPDCAAASRLMRTGNKPPTVSPLHRPALLRPRSTRRQQHRHIAALHARIALGLRNIPHLLNNALDQATSQFGMGYLTATK